MGEMNLSVQCYFSSGSANINDYDLFLFKESTTDDVDIEEPIATETSYNLGENQPYQYLQPVLQPDSINQHIRKQPRPFRRQSLDIQEIQAQALEPVTSVLGPDAAVRMKLMKVIDICKYLLISFESFTEYCP